MIGKHLAAEHPNRNETQTITMAEIFSFSVEDYSYS